MPKILLDAAILAHFTLNRKLDLLDSLFPNSIILLDIVYDRIRGRSEMRHAVHQLQEKGSLQIVSYYNYNPFLKFQDDGYGEGESASLAFAESNRGTIVTSNSSRFKRYCQHKEVLCYNTLDLLCLAMENGLMTTQACDAFIQRLIAREVPIKVVSIRQYECCKVVRPEGV